MDEEACKCHLVQRAEGAEEDSDAAVAEEATQ